MDVAAENLGRIRESTIKIMSAMTTWSAARQEEMLDELVGLIGVMVDIIKHAVVLMITSTVVEMGPSTKAAVQDWTMMSDTYKEHWAKLAGQFDEAVAASIGVRASLDRLRNPILEACCVRNLRLCRDVVAMGPVWLLTARGW